MAEHRPARSESLQPHTERSSRPDPEPSSAEADVYVWHYELLVVHARKEECLSRYRKINNIFNYHVIQITYSSNIIQAQIC